MNNTKWYWNIYMQSCSHATAQNFAELAQNIELFTPKQKKLYFKKNISTGLACTISGTKLSKVQF